MTRRVNPPRRSVRRYAHTGLLLAILVVPVLAGIAFAMVPAQSPTVERGVPPVPTHAATEVVHPGSVVLADYSGPSTYSGSIDSWINQALTILEAHGYSASLMNPNDIMTIIMHESSGNPSAINNSDGNAAAGTPSEGLMQVIGPTFDAYALPGYDNIWNPVHNIIAAVRYIIDKYGSTANVPGVISLKEGGYYVGY
jgi:Transglycosylase SLT domain